MTRVKVDKKKEKRRGEKIFLYGERNDGKGVK